MFSNPLFWIAAGYLLGAVPFGLLLARGMGVDLRSVGSGNIGATNVLRTGNKGLAAATLLLDAGKGFAAVWLAQHFVEPNIGALIDDFVGGDPSSMHAYLIEHAGIAAGVAAFVGHVYPVWLRFKGGKGVATLLGVTLAVLPAAALAFAVLWLGVAALTRYSSLAGLVAAIAVPLTAVALERYDIVLWLVAMALLLIWKHRENIARLRAGTESRIGAKK